MQSLTYVVLINLAHYYEKRSCQLCASGQLALDFAIFEFGRGLHGNTYTSVLWGLILTPGPLYQVASQYVEVELYEKNLGWLIIVNFLITLANEADDGNCIVTKK